MSRFAWGRALDGPEQQAGEFDRLFSAIGLSVGRSETWAVKVNLTYPRPAPGVVTSRETAEGLALWGAERGIRMVWVESDGGNRSHRAADVLEACHFVELAKRYGGDVRAMTEDRWVETPMSVDGEEFSLPLPAYLVDRPFDRFVDLPVIKTHIFSTVSLGIKNLWGCIPDPLRMYHHHRLDRGIVGLARALRPDLAIYDGRTALDGNGPINGRPVPARTIAVADSVGGGDRVVARAMGFEPDAVRHLRLALSEGVAPPDREAVVAGAPPPSLPSSFRMERTLYNYGSIVANVSPRLQKLVYHSPFSKYIYALVSPLRRGTRAEGIRRRFVG